MLQQKLAKLLKPVAEGLGYEYIGCECLNQGKRMLLRVYIDKASPGLTIDDCALASRQFSAVLDVESPLSGSYYLEVSSPGIDRPLFTLAQWRQVVAQQVKVKLFRTVDESKNLKGLLKAVEGESLIIYINGVDVSIDFDNVSKANVVGQVDFRKNLMNEIMRQKQ